MGGLIRSCHRGPTVAVTAFAIVLAVLAGNDAASCALVGVAVLFGQLSIGWSNDWLDAGRDAAVGRTDKPVAAGIVAIPVVETAAAVAVVATIACSALLGWRSGAMNLVVVACGWAYNLGAKAKWWSWLPYAIAFGSLPTIATLALPEPRLPGAWAVAAGGLLGVAGHLTNALPDLGDDERVGVRGLPHRLGARRSLLLTAALLLLAACSIVVGPPGSAPVISWIGLGVIVVLVAASTRIALRNPASRVLFLGIIAMTAVDVVLLVVSGGRLR